jgi:hypothetical protein
MKRKERVVGGETYKAELEDLPVEVVVLSGQQLCLGFVQAPIGEHVPVVVCAKEIREADTSLLGAVEA